MTPSRAFNDYQQQGVLYSLLDLDHRMAELEAILTRGLTPSPFCKYVNDLSPTEHQVVRDYFARIREHMLACLHEGDIPLDVRRTSLRWALQVGAIGMSIAVSEISPDRLRGYGPLDSRGAATAVKIQQELYRLIDRFAAYLRQGLGRDLAARLARLDAAPASVASLTAVDRIITRRGLVEFRPLLDQVVRRLEAPQFEIAVFGRVSSGKSSLLNHVAGVDVLPVGVTPITAVPTRLVCGEPLAARISFAEGEPQIVGVEELAQYASEEGTPGNHKRVTYILVQAPSPRLREGVVLVDTPGVGSLARSGSAETFAYLPRCDLGVVLIDAASTLTPDDLSLIRLLYEAAIPAQVVLSKADLLTPADRERTVGYVHELLHTELGLDLPVHPVSTVGVDEALLMSWFEQEIAPLMVRHQNLAEASLRRKIAHLRESVIAVLQTLLARHGSVLPGMAPSHVENGRELPLIHGQAVRRLLDGADEAIRKARDRCRCWGADRPALVEIVLRDAARAVVSSDDPVAATEAPYAALEQGLIERGLSADETVTGLQQSLTRALEGLEQASPSTQPDTASVREVAFRGLPPPDLLEVRPILRAARPWWASLLPRLAVRATRRQVERRLRRVVSEQIDRHDRQVQAWLTACLGQLIGLYEAQAEVFREQAHRLTHSRDGAAETGEPQGLAADLRELQQVSPAERDDTTEEPAQSR